MRLTNQIAGFAIQIMRLTNQIAELAKWHDQPSEIRSSIIL